MTGYPSIVVCVGASAGGHDALRTLFTSIDPTTDAAFLVVLHLPMGADSALDRMIGRVTELEVSQAKDGRPIRRGHVYVAVPDVHLLAGPGRVLVRWGPAENRFRPAIDPLLRSASTAHGPRAVGILLSGSGDDGTVGLRTIRARGGLAIVQDPGEALHPALPRRAIAVGAADRVLPAAEMGRALSERARALGPAREPPATSGTAPGVHPHGRPSSFSCPDCGGVPWEANDPAFADHVCRGGHAYAAEALFGQQEDALEDALWSAIRALEERADLSGRIGARMRGRESAASADHFRRRRDEAERTAATLRWMVDRMLQGKRVGAAEGREGEIGGDAG